MSQEITLILLAMVIGFGAVVWWLNNKLKQLGETSKQDQNLLQIIEGLQKVPDNLQRNLQDQSKTFQTVMAMTNKNITDALHQSNKAMNERLDNAAKYIAQVSKEVGQMSEIGRNMQELQEFLKSPKLRGNIGEEVLKDLIGQMLPKNSFHLQYSFKSGNKVDAALKTAAGILPIDSKFPMENFRAFVKAETKAEQERSKKDFINDVRKHIRDIAQKYILPDEGTMDMALMYVPSESVYYEVVNALELSDYARSLRVYPVSPSTLYAHLQMILLSFEGQKIEVRSRQVFTLLRAVQKDYEKTDGVLQVLGRHLTNAYNQMSNVTQHFSLLGQKLTSTQILDKTEDQPLLDK
jgi:DNA recombination protein RmuC